MLGPEMSTEVDILPDLQQNGTLLVPFNSEGGENDAALASHPSVLGMVLKGSKYKGLAVPVRLHVSGASSGALSSCLLHSLRVQPREWIDVVGLSVLHLES